MKNSEKIADKLNDLLAKNYDSEKGFKLAAEKVSDSQMKRIFEIRAENRYDFGHKLKAEIRKHGKDPDKGTSVKGDIHHFWITIKEALSRDKEEAILEEVIRGEKVAVADYESVIAEEDLQSSTKEMLKEQLSNIKSALEQVKTFQQNRS